MPRKEFGERLKFASITFLTAILVVGFGLFLVKPIEGAFLGRKNPDTANSVLIASAETTDNWKGSFGAIIGKIFGVGGDEPKLISPSPEIPKEAPAPPLLAVDFSQGPEETDQEQTLSTLIARVDALSFESSFNTFKNLKTTAANLLRNSSFEEESGGAPRQWNYNLDGSSANVFRTDEAHRTGNYSLKFKGENNGNFGISQPAVKTIKRRAYTLSAWLKATDVPSNTSFKLVFWDEVGNKRASTSTFNLSGTKEWYRIETTIDNTDGWEGKKWYPMVEINALASGAIYLDDIQLEEGEQASVYHFGGGGGSTNDTATGIGDGSVLAGTDGSLYPAIANSGSLGIGANPFRELHLTKASIDNNGNLTLEGSATVKGRGYFKENLDVSGAATISGNLRVDGTSAFGGAMTLTGNLLPGTNDAYNLGSATSRWKDIFLGPETMHIGTSATDEGTISFDTTNNDLTINSTGDL